MSKKYKKLYVVHISPRFNFKMYLIYYWEASAKWVKSMIFHYLLLPFPMLSNRNHAAKLKKYSSVIKIKQSNQYDLHCQI